MADSSFSYSSLFKGKTLMVIIPHEDDEINIAGSTYMVQFLRESMLFVFFQLGEITRIPRISAEEKP